MVENRIMAKAFNAIKCALSLLLLAALAACATAAPTTKSSEHIIKENIPRSSTWQAEPKAFPDEPLPPPFVSMPEEIIPFKTKILNF